MLEGNTALINIISIFGEKLRCGMESFTYLEKLCGKKWIYLNKPISSSVILLPISYILVPILFVVWIIWHAHHKSQFITLQPPSCYSTSLGRRLYASVAIEFSLTEGHLRSPALVSNIIKSWVIYLVFVLYLSR